MPNPAKRTRSPTWNGRADSSTTPAKILPNVCCVARPSTIAVSPAPAARVPGSDPQGAGSPALRPTRSRAGPRSRGCPPSPARDGAPSAAAPAGRRCGPPPSRAGSAPPRRQCGPACRPRTAACGRRRRAAGRRGRARASRAAGGHAGRRRPRGCAAPPPGCAWWPGGPRIREWEASQSTPRLRGPTHPGRDIRPGTIGACPIACSSPSPTRPTR